jgi:hypothetical protein
MIAVGLGLFAAAIGAPRDATACGFAVERTVDPTSRFVASAEKSLDQAQYVNAATLAIRAFPDVKTAAPSDPLRARALRIVALSLVRADGALAIGPDATTGFRSDTAEAREKNVTWATTALRQLNAKRKNDPGLQTALGEALAKSPATRDEAAKLLGSLAEKDLVTTAEGWAALAKLRDAAGDRAARDVAVKRCEALATSPKLCQIGAPAKSS